MKNLPLSIAFLFLISYSTYAQRVNVYPNNSYVQENLDLNAVGLLFERSRDILDFEKKINYTDQKISNLDLNNDGRVDYLKVSDKIVNNIKIIKIQSEISPNIYEDVASINVILKNRNRPLNTSVYNYRSNANASTYNIERSREIYIDKDINRERNYYKKDPIERTKEVVPLIYDFINIYSIVKNLPR
ncbi:hypothetical protein [Flavobacterium chungangensis]|uniref:EF-hand domain-containing protein n=1 Tax=Flavobacterium chungangensis TaxID=2708132 RepID=A0ABV8ZED9_9FLAO